MQTILQSIISIIDLNACCLITLSCASISETKNEKDDIEALGRSFLIYQLHQFILRTADFLFYMVVDNPNIPLAVFLRVGCKMKH